MDRSSATSSLQKLPAVGTLISSPAVQPLVERYGRALVAEAARQAIQQARQEILAGAADRTVGVIEVEAQVKTLSALSLRRVINATGVIVHTNLGRAPLAEAAQQAMIEAARSYSTLEFDLDAGRRGSRHSHVSKLLCDLLSAEDGIAVNNCAGAVLLMLAAICKGGEVIVARGQLVEIGGGFRVPDVMRESGADLVEVGTTNKVYARDYEAAITERTRAILVVHRSNFALVGFTAEPEIAELKEVASRHDIPLLADLGSGLIAPESVLGEAALALRGEPRPAQMLKSGADLIAFSGDKMLGGPQAGILAGERSLVERCKRHPLARALRADKLTVAALEATLRLYRDERAETIPVVQSLGISSQQIRERAERVVAALAPIEAQVIPTSSVVGGGALPLVELESYAVQIGDSKTQAALLEELRRGDPPVVARVIADRTALDLRTVPDSEIPELLEAVRRASSVVGSV